MQRRSPPCRNTPLPVIVFVAVILFLFCCSPVVDGERIENEFDGFEQMRNGGAAAVVQRVDA